MYIGKYCKSETMFQVSVLGGDAQSSPRAHVLCERDRVGKTEGLLLALNFIVFSGLFVKAPREAILPNA